MKQEIIDEENIRKMELKIRKGDQDKLNDAATKIQNLYIRKIKKKREAKEMRE